MTWWESDEHKVKSGQPHVFKGEIRNKKTNRTYLFRFEYHWYIEKELAKKMAVGELASAYAKGDVEILARDFYITWE